MIRSAKESDLDRIYEIAAASFDRPWKKEELGRYIGGETEKITVFDENGVQGFVVYAAVGDETEIYDIAVCPFFRRRGAGKALLFQCMDGAKRAFLEVREGNSAARALYESCGFKAVGVRKKYYSDGEDAVVMIWNG